MKKFILNYTDGYHIRQIGCYDTMSEVQAEMRQRYSKYNSGEWFMGLRELNDTSARLYDSVIELHIWSIATIDIP